MRTEKMKAKRLMQDDRFKMAGQFYRIADLQITDSGKICIQFYAISPVAETTAMHTMLVSKKTKFKVYYC